MMNFRTELQVQKFPFQINHQNALLSIGSCFTEHIGARLSALKFNHLQNPFGIVYNPISIAEQLEWLLSDNVYPESELFENQGLWHSWAHHGSFSGLNKNEVLTKINESLRQAQTHLPAVSRLLLTLGTASIFKLKENGRVVANCHKMPGQVFEKQRLTIDEIVARLLPVLQRIKIQNTDLQVVVTVSPVRHIRDGLIENQRSKATLLLAIDTLCEKLNFVHYFPAYELILDDLRDYRFFNADMIHPNETAIDYVWQRLGTAFFTTETQDLIRQVESILQASRHRPFNAQSAHHQIFMQIQLSKMEQLEAAYPFLNFLKEKQLFQQQ